MLEYDRIDVSEGINNDKSDKSCECMICHHLYFLRMNFRFQAKVCDDCDNVTQKSMSFNGFAIAAVQKNEYIIYF